jgi:hypothetical protein
VFPNLGLEKLGDSRIEMHPYPSTTRTPTTPSTSRTESTIIESRITTSTTPLLSAHATTATPPTLLEDADKRFIFTFRGRTIHPTIDLPPRYAGLTLRWEGNDVMNPVVDDAAVADIEAKGRAKSGKTGSGGTKGKRK